VPRVDTGDRPYMCVLCRDTFSRSDILKRHFQKCSIRRGNPTGASHLSHPQAHVRKHAAAQKALGAEGDLNNLNGLGNLSGDGMVPFGMMPVSDGSGNLASDQSQLSRSSSLNRLENGSNQDRRSMTGSVMGASSRGGSFENPYGDVSGSMPHSMNQQIPQYNMPPSQNGMPMYGGSNPNQQSGLDWSQMFQAGAQDTYVNSFNPNIGQTQIGIKPEPNGSGRAATAASAVADSAPVTSYDERMAAYPWGLPPSDTDPYLQLSNQILNFFYPPGSIVTHENAGMNLYFSATNVKNFLENYTHFHVHFPFLHTPTVRIMETYTGLLAGMCCIGACYSQRVDSSHVREMMDFLQSSLEHDSPLLRSAGSMTDLHQQQNGGDGHGTSQRDVEELQAIVMLQILLTWNGTPQQRQHAREIHPYVVNHARQLGLLRPSRNETLFSPLHQPGFDPQSFDSSKFDWKVWVEQEKRIRVMHLVFLCDAAFALYFNMTPLIDVLELTIPLPSDDGAWDAKTSQDCAGALGLLGPEVAREKNPDGTQRCKQPELDLALRALLHMSYQIQPGSTNLYGKFILVHAILSLIRRAQIDGNDAAMAAAGDFVGTPPLSSDWMLRTSTETNGSANTSGRATPVNDGAQLLTPQILKMFSTALDKFKSNWDADMANQFPPSRNYSPRRYGFSRDGIHFFWLAKYLLTHTRSSEFQMAPDTRFSQVIQLLKSVKAWVMSDGASRGEELGSVGDIDKDFGVLDLTLEMSKLFKPLQTVVDSAEVTSVQTEI
jgi:hypothetical protein